MVKLAEINPFVRDAEIQNAILEGEKERYAYDHRLFYVLENSGEIIIEGERHPLNADTVVFIPPEVGYRFCGKMKVALFNFDMTRALRSRDKAICPPVKELFSPELLFDRTLLDGFEGYKIVHDAIFVRERFLEAVRVWSEAGEYGDAESSSGLKSILTDLARHGENKPLERDNLCSKIYAYIRLNAEKDINNSVLAKYFGYHPVYLGEIFKEKTGVSIHQAIISERIRLAKRWLSETDSAVEEIAYEVGFSSRSHFCTAFKSHTGVTPLCYRKNSTK